MLEKKIMECGPILTLLRISLEFIIGLATYHLEIGEKYEHDEYIREYLYLSEPRILLAKKK